MELLEYQTWTEWQRGGGGGSSDTVAIAINQAMKSLYFRHYLVDRHHFIIQKSQSMFSTIWLNKLLQKFHQSTQFLWFLMHSCWDMIDLCNQCGYSLAGTHWYALTLVGSSSSQNCCVKQIPCRCETSCAISTHLDYVNFGMYWMAMIMWA